MHGGSGGGWAAAGVGVAAACGRLAAVTSCVCVFEGTIRRVRLPAGTGIILLSTGHTDARFLLHFAAASDEGLAFYPTPLFLHPPAADPYLNVDAGTMSPFEHGEVFVLDDGGEVRGTADG